MYRKVILTLLVISVFAVTAAVAGPTGTTKATTAKPMAAKSGGVSAMHSTKFANGVAVCGCGKVFVPNAKTLTFTYEGKEYACCSEECHKKLASMTPAEAAKACETQMAKLEAAPATAAAPETK